MGCGYTGRVLAAQLATAGWRVRGTTTREEGRAAIEAVGAEAFVSRFDRPDTLRPVLAAVDVVFHLAPPPKDGPLEPEWDGLAASLDSQATTFVYGSTTGAFGQHEGSPWIDEDTPTVHLGARGQRRYDYEQGLSARLDDLRIVRIAGIYGPGRTIWAALQRPGFMLFEGGPPTSRTHVDDLARLLAAMAADGAPRMAIACDESPAPTLEVARYACQLMGVPEPVVVSQQDARERLSPAALEMRMGGRRCRSKVRPALVGPLRYPTYESGVRASLIAEGLLSPEAGPS